MRLRCPIVLALMAALISASAIGVGAVRLTIYDVGHVAETKAIGAGTEFGQVFRSQCDGSLVSVAISDRSKARKEKPVTVTVSIHEADRVSDRIGSEQRVIIGGDGPSVTAEWAPGDVPMRAGYCYYLRLVGDRFWHPAMNKKLWDRQPYWSGCAFADDGVVVIPQPDHDLVATLVVDTAPAKAMVHPGPTMGKASAGDLAPWWRVTNAGGSDLWVIGASDGTAVDEIVMKSPALVVIGQGERALVNSPAAAWFDGSANLLRNGNFEFGNSYWRRCPDAPVVHGTDVMLSRSLRSRFRDKSTYHVWLPSNLPTGDSVCVSSSPVAVKPDTEYYVGGVYSAEFVEGAEALLSVVETGDDGATLGKFLMQLGRYAEWQPAAQRLRTGPRAQQVRLKFSLTTISGGEVLWDAFYLVAADDVKLARAGLGEEPTAEWTEDLLARGLEALRAGDTVTAARTLTQVLAKSPASPEARQAMHHLLDPWADESDRDQAWASWRAAMLATYPMPPPKNGGPEAALAYLRMGYVLASHDIGEVERLGECFQWAMVWGDASFLPLEAAEDARRCCQDRDKAMAVLRTITRDLPDGGEPWALLQKAVFEKNAGKPEEAIAVLRRAANALPSAGAAATAACLLAALDTDQGKILVSQGRNGAAVPLLREAVAMRLPEDGEPNDLGPFLTAVQLDALHTLACVTPYVAREVKEETLETVGARLRGLQGADTELMNSTYCLGMCYMARGDGRLAAEWLRRSADVGAQANDVEHAYASNMVAVSALRMAGDYDAAVRLLGEMVALFKANETRLSRHGSLDGLEEYMAQLERGGQSAPGDQ